jgi:hypothetical protein
MTEHGDKEAITVYAEINMRHVNTLLEKEWTVFMLMEVVRVTTSVI